MPGTNPFNDSVSSDRGWILQDEVRSEGSSVGSAAEGRQQGIQLMQFDDIPSSVQMGGGHNPTERGPNRLVEEGRLFTDGTPQDIRRRDTSDLGGARVERRLNERDVFTDGATRAPQSNSGNEYGHRITDDNGSQRYFHSRGDGRANAAPTRHSRNPFYEAPMPVSDRVVVEESKQMPGKYQVPVSTFPPDSYWNAPRIPSGSNQRVQVPTYDGTSPLKDYLVQFELIAELNGWDEFTQALQLAASLRGPANAVLADLEPRRRREFGLLVDALEHRFGRRNQTELFKAMLRNRSRQPSETLPEMAHDIKRLLSRAYPDASLEMKETLAKDFFIDALGDSDVKWKVYQARPMDLDDALTVAVELEAFGLAESKKLNRKLGVRTIGERQDTKSGSGEIKDLTETISAALAKGFEELTERLTKMQKPTKVWQGDKKKPNDGKCWGCGELGHYRRDCPHEQEGKTTTGENIKQGNEH